MNSILVLFDPPAPMTPGRDLDRANWLEHLGKLSTKAKKASGCDKLTENLWQIVLPTRLPFLVELLSAAAACKIPYRILQLEEGQIWISPHDA
jgi:hypothetical protein